MTRPGFEDCDGYDWTMDYFFRVAAVVAGIIAFSMLVWLVGSALV